MEDLADVATTEDSMNAIDATVNGIEVVVPSDGGSAIQINSAEITLPEEARGGAGQTLLKGLVGHEGSEVDSAVAVKEDGSVQIATVIADPAAAESFTYEISVPAGVTWTELKNGALLATDSAGSLVLGIAPAWAVDADGKSVPTRYVLEGSRLAQTVDHHSGDYAYPIVADPWLGAAIFYAYSWSASTPKASQLDVQRRQPQVQLVRNPCPQQRSQV